MPVHTKSEQLKNLKKKKKKGGKKDAKKGNPFAKRNK